MKRCAVFLTSALVLWASAPRAQRVDYINSFSWYGMNDVIVSDSLAYVGMGFGLMLFNVSDPAAPEFVSRLYAHGEVYDMFHSGDYLYMPAREVGLRIADVSDPHAPVLLNSRVMHESYTSVFVSGSYAYAVDAIDEAMDIITVSNPANPMVANSCPIPQPVDIAIQGNYAYVVGPGLFVYDISNPTDPVLVGYYGFPFWGWEIILRGNYAYVSRTSPNNGGALEIIDISNPSDPALVGEFEPGHSPLYSLALNGNYAYQLPYIVDISNPTDPRRINRLWTIPTANGIVIDGDYAFVASQIAGPLAGLTIFDISDPDTGSIAGRYLTAEWPTWDIKVSGGYAYTAAHRDGLVITDISDETNPVFVSKFPSINNASHVAVRGEYAYLSAGGLDLQIIDVSNRAAPTLAASYRAIGGHPQDVEFAGNLAFVAYDWAGLRILNIENPASPVFVGEYGDSLDIGIFDVVLRGNRAYLAAAAAGLLIVDITDPAQPALVSSCALLGGVGIDVEGNLAVVAQHYAGLAIVDISDEMMPVQVGSFNSPYSIAIKNVYIDGDLIIAASFPEGLLFVDISDPANPWLIQTYNTPASIMTPGACENFEVVGDRIYVADCHGALILRYTPTGIDGDPGPNLPGNISVRNHPNPFNAATTISYSLSAPGPLSLNIYDILGRKVATLFQGIQPAGEHRAIWNASAFPSGLYFARLTAGERVEAVKLLLIR